MFEIKFTNNSKLHVYFEDNFITGIIVDGKGTTFKLF